MLKKVIVTSLLVSTLLQAQMKEKGFFVGIDGSTSSANIAYAKSGSAITTSDYESDDRVSALSLKLGYQYYFTKIYARVNKNITYSDQSKDRFKVKNCVIEMNVDYSPIFYMPRNSNYIIRGVFGAGVGVNKSALTEYDARLDAIGTNLNPILDKQTQYNMEYGYNLAIVGELDFGLSIEAGYRYRYGLLTEFSDETSGNEATFTLSTGEFFLGVNYLF
jgi:hypothetical protein